MVAYGYILPKKNQNNRLETLSLGLKNQNIKNVNAQLNLAQYRPLTITSNVPSIVEQTGQQIPQKVNEIRPAELTSTKIDEIRPPEGLKMLYQLSGVKEDEIRMPSFVAGSDITKSIEDLVKKLLDNRYRIFGKVAEQTLNLTPENLRTLSQQLSARDKRERIKQVRNKKLVIEEIKKNNRILQEARDYLQKYYNDINYPEYDRLDVNKTNLYEINKEITNLFEAGIDNYDNYSESSDIPLIDLAPSSTGSTIPMLETESPPDSTTAQTDLTWTSSVDLNFQNLPEEAKKVVLFYEKFQNDKLTLSAFKKIIEDNKKPIQLNLTGDNRKLLSLRVPISKTRNITTESDAQIESKAFKYYKKNPQEFYNRIKQLNENEFSGLIIGAGLKGSKVKSQYYSNYHSNFGNLYLKEDSLKKNQLTIYKPYSKITVASKSGITPLLKKMIFDIQNTLEFDTRDYQNLEADEKRVIERIIRGQKNMKNYNIQALIDEDDFKAKKRLDILVGQINAGNNSTLIREEMRALLKKLYDNKAISQPKYRTSLKAIKALES